ncbi:unnamed protein product [Adineta ricciae]|uniref:Uncharacterized protein n=1 Tax=Adineta ricciae TaxID=249248 RepID=A0A815U3S1_ADIRI|nr:unnamed protein product [Adineta ricciae]
MLPRSNNPTRKWSVPGYSEDFMEAVFHMNGSGGRIYLIWTGTDRNMSKLVAGNGYRISPSDSWHFPSRNHRPGYNSCNNLSSFKLQVLSLLMWSIALIFEIKLRILHTMTQIEDMRHLLINDYCSSILLHMTENATNKLFRLIISFSVAESNDDNSIDIRLTADDVAVLFRFYYECTVSQSQTAYGLQHADLLNRFSVFGRCGYTLFNVKRD